MWKDDIKKAWSIIKETNGKRKVSSDFPNKQVINDIEITGKILIADRFNQSFVNISHELATQIPQRKNIFHHILMAPHLHFKKFKL